MYSSSALATALAALVTFTSALPKSKQNWELVTNELGYTVSRFKEGMQPGSEDYNLRFGDLSINSTTLMARDESRYTSPYVGKTRIPYGCNTDIGNYVLVKLYDLCDEDRCDGGTGAEVTVTYPDGGKRKDATVSMTVSGQYPHGQKDNMIKAVQQLVPQNGVDYYDVTSYGPHISPHAIPGIAKCEVVGASNFLSIVVRNKDDESLVGVMDVSLTFTMGENGAICGTIATVAKEIAGAISGIAGGLFGIVQAVSCK